MSLIKTQTVDHAAHVAGKAGFCGSFPIGKGSGFTSGVDWRNDRLFRRWIRWQGQEDLHFELIKTQTVDHAAHVAGKAGFCDSFPIGKGSGFTSGVDRQNARLFRCWIRWQGQECLHFEQEHLGSTHVITSTLAPRTLPRFNSSRAWLAASRG